MIYAAYNCGIGTRSMRGQRRRSYNADSASRLIFNELFLRSHAGVIQSRHAILWLYYSFNHTQQLSVQTPVFRWIDQQICDREYIAESAIYALAQVSTFRAYEHSRSHIVWTPDPSSAQLRACGYYYAHPERRVWYRTIGERGLLKECGNTC